MKKCKDCGKDFVSTGRNHKRCTDCKLIEEKRKQKEYDRKSVYKRDYGITIEQYNQMFEEQKGCCKICGTHQSVLPKSLAVDHCHNTSKVRGLLCMNCNLLLGYAKDAKEILESAIRYLK
jgi:hypothetical protein